MCNQPQCLKAALIIFFLLVCCKILLIKCLPLIIFAIHHFVQEVNEMWYLGRAVINPLRHQSLLAS